MDIKTKIEELVKKITSDKDIMAKFTKNPVKTVEDLLGVDLPDEQIKQLVNGVKAKIDLKKIGDMVDGVNDGKFDLGDAAEKLGSLLGKK